MKLLVAVGALVASVAAQSATSSPREPWTTSTIIGAPEPPKAFLDERALPRLRFAEGLELAKVPGTNRLLVVERRGKIRSFPVRDDVATADDVIDLRALHPRLAHAFGVVLHPRFRETREI